MEFTACIIKNEANKGLKGRNIIALGESLCVSKSIILIQKENIDKI